MSQNYPGAAPSAQDSPGHWAELAPQLRELREDLGAPTFTDIASRVTELRQSRGLPRTESQVGRVTVYDCFRDDRKRVDHALVLDIVTALGASHTERQRWEALLEAFRQRRSASSIVTVSDELPQDSMPFVGREQLVNQIGSAPTPFWLSGMPGAGKTRLAVAAAAELKVRGISRRTLFADLRGHSSAGPPADPDVAINALLRLLGVPSHQRTGDRRSRSSRLRQLLQTTKSTLILDDTANTTQVLRILERPTDLPVIVTSRHQLDEKALAGFTSLALGAFTPEESHQLLRQVVGAERVDAEATATAALAEASAHLPLALGLTASRIAARTDWSLTEQLELITSRQSALRVNDEVAESFTLSYQRLTEGAQQMFRLMAAYPVTALSHESAVALSSGFVNDPTAALEQLVEHHLLTQPQPATYSMHSLLRLHAADLSAEMDRPTARQTSKDNLYRFLITEVWSAYRQYMVSLGHSPRSRLDDDSEQSSVHHDDGTAFFRANTDLLLYAAHHAVPETKPSPLTAISETLCHWLLRMGRAEEAEQLHRSALLRAEAAGDLAAEHRARVDLAQVLIYQGRFPEIEQTLKGVADAGLLGPEDMCSLHNVLGNAMEHLGQNASSSEHYEKCIAAAREVQDDGMLATALNNLAGLHNRVGAYHQAQEVLAESVQISQRLGDDFGMARGMVNLASIQIHLNQLDEAEENLRKGLERFQKMNSVRGQTAALSSLGRVLLDQGCFEEAVEVCHEGTELAHAEGLDQFNVTLQRQLSRGLRSLGQLEAAQSAAEDAVSLARKMYDPTETGESLDQLAQCLLAAGHPDAAQELWQEALPLLEIAESTITEEVQRRLNAFSIGSD